MKVTDKTNLTFASGVNTVRDELGNSICRFYIAFDIDDDNVEKISKRIVTCVNACEGVSEEDLQPGCVKKMMRQRKPSHNGANEMKIIDKIIERLNDAHSKAVDDYLDDVELEIEAEIAYLERLKEPTDKMLSEGSIAICGKDQKMYRDDARITLKVMIEAAEEQE